MRLGSLLLSQSTAAPSPSPLPASQRGAGKDWPYPTQPFMFLQREPLSYVQHAARARHWEQVARRLVLSLLGLPFAGIPIAVALWHRSKMEWLARASARTPR